MIGYLKGRVEMIESEGFILDVGGVGYQVSAGAAFLAGLQPGSEVACAIETVVREDSIRLIGFSTHEQRAWFRLLLSIQGVGPVAAMAITDALSPESIADAVALGDAASFALAKGIGKKTAQRIVLELKGKAGPLILEASTKQESALSETGSSKGKMRKTDQPAPLPQGDRSEIRRELISALKNLGFDELAVQSAVAQVLRGRPDQSELEQLLPEALKQLSAMA